MKKVILTCFAGRREYLEIQVRYIVKLLDAYDYIEYYDIWNFSWSDEDISYVESLISLHPKIRIKHAPDYGKASRGNQVASKQFAYYFTEAYNSEHYKDYLFIKIDDDVVYVDLLQFNSFIQTAASDSEHFLISANVINSDLRLNDPTPLHEEFFTKIADILQDGLNEEFSNEERLSINFVAWSGEYLDDIKKEFSNGIGADDEWRLCHTLAKRLGKQNLIVTPFKVVHFNFGNQQFDKARYLQVYKELCNMII